MLEKMVRELSCERCVKGALSVKPEFPLGKSRPTTKDLFPNVYITDVRKRIRKWLKAFIASPVNVYFQRDTNIDFLRT